MKRLGLGAQQFLASLPAFRKRVLQYPRGEFSRPGQQPGNIRRPLAQSSIPVRRYGGTMVIGMHRRLLARP